MLTQNIARPRDVFICFSKSRPGEAKIAFALKDVLEQHGLSAFEYEDWNWIDSGVGREADVDRATLHQMLTTCSVVVLISPHRGETTAGVQTELAELRSCGSPVILLHWSPWGWHPRLEPDRFDGLNIVWDHEGNSTSDLDVADNQCEFIARQLGIGSWLACQIHCLNAEYATTAGTLLARLPEDYEHPLLNLRLRQVACDPTQSKEAVDIPALAAEIAAAVEPDAIRGFVKFWRSGTNLMAASIAKKAQFELIRPMHMFVSSCDSLCHAGEKRFGSYELSGAELKDRAIALIRLDRSDEAIILLKQAVDSVPDEERYMMLQTLALAQQEADPQGAIQSLTSAIECSPQLEIECVLTYNRGAHRTEAGQHAAALGDFSFVIDKCKEAPIRQSALRARARAHTKLQNYDAAIADYTQVLEDAKSAPRMAVSAWMDRAALYKLQHRDAEAIEDLTRAIAAADADLLQRFRSLEARAELFEGSGQALAAASDYEAMAAYMNASREYQQELRQKAAHLRRR